MLGLRCHFISLSGKSPTKLEVTSRQDHSCLVFTGTKSIKSNKKQQPVLVKFEGLATRHVAPISTIERCSAENTIRSLLGTYSLVS